MNATFLFGAGADSEYGVCTGADFRKQLILADCERKISGLCGENSAIKTARFLYPTSLYPFLQTIYDEQEKACAALGPRAVNRAKKYYEGDQNYKKKAERTRQDCRTWYDLLCGKRKGRNHKAADFFLENMVFFDSLDEKMNDLRHEKLSKKGKRIINAYWTIFILMMENVYEMKEDDWTLSRVFDKLSAGRKEMLIKDFDKESYYSLLRDYMQRHTENKYFISSTNYTAIMDEVLRDQVEESVIAYLHGKLNWFEDRVNLTVYDCTNEEDRRKAEEKAQESEQESAQEKAKGNMQEKKEVLLPFILIPSGVKPLICDQQLREFHKFMNGLDQSQLLYVVGYRFNTEDNHINALIAEWLRKEGHCLIYYNFRHDLDWKKPLWAKAPSFADFIKPVGEDDAFPAGDIRKANVKILDITTNGRIAHSRFEEGLSLMAH